MPNWCDNTIEIHGDRDKIKALWDAIQQHEEQGLLQALRPEPDYDAVKVEPAYPSNDGKPDPMPAWWNWRVAHWGTKWEVETDSLSYDEGKDGNATIHGFFESAWSPPLEALQFYAEENPDVLIRIMYFEAGMGFIGEWNSEGVDYYCNDVTEHLKIKLEDDPTLYELMDEFNVWQHYEWEEE